MTDHHETTMLPALPEGWVWTAVGEIYDTVGGGTPSTQESGYWGGDIPWITSADIHGLQDVQPRKFITPQAVDGSTTRLVPAGSLIVVTRVGLGKVAIAPTALCFSQDSQALVSHLALINPKYALYYLSQAVQIFKYQNRGTTIPGVTKKQLQALPFPLAPLAEQCRIVEAIEALFTQLDAGVAALKRVQRQVQRYKASVLKAACEGRLVPQDPTDEPAADLLRRILAERRAAWKGKGKYQEPAGPDTEGLPELPEGWTWASTEQLTGLVTSGSRGWAEYYSDEGAVFIRAQNINTDELVLDSVAFVTLPESAEGVRSRLRASDILITITGANVTKSALVRHSRQEAYVSQHVALVRPILSNTAPYLYHWIVSPTHGRGGSLWGGQTRA